MNGYDYYILFWICVFGLCLGSFYNVVIIRSISNQSIVFPPSNCPKCKNRLFWWHNIPILSYLILRGKCYFCNEKISLQYPLVELLTMLLFGASFIKFGISVKTLFVMFWISGLIIMSGTDIKEKIVDCNIAIAIAVSGLIYSYLSTGNCVDSLYGIIAGALLLEIIARSGYLFVGTRALGEADSFVAGALGAIFGLHNILWVLLYSLAVAMIWIVPQFFYHQFKSGNKSICIFSILFILAGLFYKYHYDNYIIMGIFVLIGIILSVEILKNARCGKSLNYFPFVPALTVAAMYYLFI